MVTPPQDTIVVDPHRQAAITLVAPLVRAQRTQGFVMAGRRVAESDVVFRQKVVMHGLA